MDSDVSAQLWDPRDGAVQRRLVHRCLQLAEQASAAGDVPVGAVVVDAAGEVIGEGFNTREAAQDPAGHAEIVALRRAAEATGSWRREGCTLVVTLEPCPMCAGAIVQTRVSTVVFGAWDEKAGAAGSVFDVLRAPQLNHWVEVHPGVLELRCAAQLGDYFAAKRG